MLQTLPTSTPRVQLIDSLARIRQEWQGVAGENSLLEVEGNMGMLLADLINGVGLQIDEQARVLGPDLFREMQDFLRSPIKS